MVGSGLRSNYSRLKLRRDHCARDNVGAQAVSLRRKQSSPATSGGPSNPYAFPLPLFPEYAASPKQRRRGANTKAERADRQRGQRRGSDNAELIAKHAASDGRCGARSLLCRSPAAFSNRRFKLFATRGTLQGPRFTPTPPEAASSHPTGPRRDRQ